MRGRLASEADGTGSDRTTDAGVSQCLHRCRSGVPTATVPAITTFTSLTAAVATSPASLASACVQSAAANTAGSICPPTKHATTEHAVH